MTTAAGDDDPFKDPTIATSHPPHSLGDTGEHMNVPDTLAVGRNASLSLGTDSLIVLGMSCLVGAKALITDKQ